jgi:hypothetical protein
MWLFLFLPMLGAYQPSQAQPITLPVFELVRSEEGLLLDFSAKFELSGPVEDALQKGVPLVFTAQALVREKRWYWRDKLINTVIRSWRLSYQPLTRKYRVSLGGLTQNYDTLADAIGTLNSSAHWKLSDSSELSNSRIYVEFRYELDTTQLPRPMQIGINGQDDWTLRIERIQLVP